MVKARPVVILTPRPRRGDLYTVVPLSSSEPDPLEMWHHPLSANAYPPSRGQMWAKCDMVNTVSRSRLDRVKVKDLAGNRTYHMYKMPEDDMEAIRQAVRIALHLP